jgi:MerR family transcriptional regulator, redox-sensitive transcriptional activator SoxR
MVQVDKIEEPMTIGEVAKRTGLRASAIRFCERAGLLLKPVRTSGQRRYGAAILDRLAVLERAKACGFTLTEIGVLFNNEGSHSAKWRALAESKIAELDSTIERIAAMKALLQRRCECATAAECGHCIRNAR